MPALERLILFDIDGTLLSAGGAPRRAFGRALIEFFGTEGTAATDRFAGKTDPQILHDLMRAAGFEEAWIDERADDFFTFYLTRLEAELRAETRHRLHPGVAELLPALAEDPRVTVGLVTGNVLPGARIKLEHFGLWEHFALGAFGSDDRERNRLVPIAVERAEARSGRRYEGDEIVVVGDTPADVACARAAGAMVVAVATGVHSTDDLAGHHPDVLLESLAEWPALLERLGLAPRRPATRASRTPRVPGGPTEPFLVNRR